MMRTSTGIVGVLLLVVLLGSFARSARADIALESWSNRRPPDAERAALERLKRALQSRGVLTTPGQIVERVGAYLPLAGYPNRAVTRTNIIERIRTAVNRAAHEAYDESSTILESVFVDLDNNPALAASDPDSRSWITNGRAALVFSYVRSGKSRLANDAIIDHIRCYPDLSLHGRQEEVEKLYDANIAVIGKMPRGKLEFSVDHADAEIFVDSVARGKRKINVELVPGAHRVVVRVSTVYRSYRMTVRSNETVARAVDWPTDTAFTIANDWVGFLGSPETLANAAIFIRELARQFLNDAVIVIGIVQRDGHRYLVASRYKAPPAQPRPAREVEIDKADDAQIEALATYLTAPALAPGPEPTVAMHAAPPRWPVLVAVGVFSASVPAGSYLLKTRNDCYNSCSPYGLPAAWGLLGVAGAALGFGIVWIIHADRDTSPAAPMLDVQPLPGGGVARVTGRF